MNVPGRRDLLEKYMVYCDATHGRYGTTKDGYTVPSVRQGLTLVHLSAQLEPIRPLNSTNLPIESAHVKPNSG